MTTLCTLNDTIGDLINFTQFNKHYLFENVVTMNRTLLNNDDLNL